MFYISFNNKEVVKILLDNNVKLDSVDHFWFTALDWAINMWNNEIISMICEKQKLNSKDIDEKNIINKLNAAINTDNVPLVEELLKKCSNIDSKTNSWYTLLRHAIYKDNYEIIKMLVEAWADLNKKDEKGNTYLYYARWKWNMEVIKYLREKWAFYI